MRLHSLPGWPSALTAARATWPRISEDVWRAVGESEAPACAAGLVRFSGK